MEDGIRTRSRANTSLSSTAETCSSVKTTDDVDITARSDRAKIPERVDFTFGVSPASGLVAKCMMA